MERDESSKRHFGHSDNINEQEYQEVKDPEDLLNMHIRPARSVQHDRQYSDRDIPWYSALGSCEKAPTCPPRETHSKPGPPVNRNMKPGRRRVPLDDKLPAVEPRVKHKQISQRPSSDSTSTDLNHLSQMNLPKASRRNRQKETKTPEVTTPSKGVGLQTGDNETANHRHSLDLDSQHDIDKRIHQNVKKQDGSSTRRQNHEWPQTKEDFDQNDFIPKERPQQTYNEEHWYVGACNRAEAEHALHLMNKDGTFLVRDCSKKTIAEPFVLAVYHERKVYNIKIRFITSTRQYALGTGQRANDMFESVADIIKFHSIFPIALIDGRNQGASYPENCVLTCPITKKDVNQLLGLETCSM